MIKTTGSEQGGPPPDSAIASATPSPLPPFSPVEPPLLSREEKRRILAQIVRLNPLDCFDDSGAFDIARAKKVLPACAVRHIVVHETTRTDPEGKPVTQRKIHLRLVDPLSAMRLDDQLERRKESPQSSGADSDALSEEREAEREAGAARARIALHEMRQDAFEEGRRSALAQLANTEEPPQPQAPIPHASSPQQISQQGSNPAAHATPQKSGRGIPAPSKEHQQPGGKTTPSSSPPFPPLSPVPVTPAKKIHTDPSTIARPPPLDPMSFAAQGRPRLVE